MTLTYDYQCRTDGHRHPLQVTPDERATEARRELEYRRTAYPRMVAKGQVSQTAADEQLATMLAIAEDMDRCTIAAAMRGGIDYRHTGPVTGTGIWTAKVHACRRELDLRRRLYPSWISKGVLQADVAKRQLEAMEAIHWAYWVDRLFWTWPPGLTLADPAYRTMMREHAEALALALPEDFGRVQRSEAA